LRTSRAARARCATLPAVDPATRHRRAGSRVRGREPHGRGGWRTARDQFGSGAPIEVRGDATQQIIVTPASGTDLDGEQVRTVYDGPERIDGALAGTSVVKEIVLTGDFEATMSWVVGTDRQAAFSVSELSDPTRVVLDIASG
jgi:hypothetical protein